MAEGFTSASGATREEGTPMDCTYEYDEETSSSTQEDQGDKEWPITVSNNHPFMAIYYRLDSDFNAFSAIVKRRQIFTGQLSKRMVDLGRKLDYLKPIIDQLGVRIDATDPQTRQQIWNKVRQEAKSLGLTSPDTALNYGDLDVVQFNTVGLEKIRTLEAKYERLQLVKIRVLSVLEQKPGQDVAETSLSPQAGASVSSLTSKTNKVMVIGDMSYELVDRLRKCTTYRVWYLPNISMKSMEMIIKHEAKEEHSELEQIFLFTGKVEIRDRRKTCDVLNDLYTLLLAIQVIYGTATRITVCCGPDLVGKSLEEKRVCCRLGVRCINVYPDDVMSSRAKLAAYIAYSISKALRGFT